MALGDSKSAPDSQTWPLTLAGMAGMRSVTSGRGGYTVDKLENNLTVNNDGGTFANAIITTVLTTCEGSANSLDRCVQALHDQPPPFILLNVGVNDVGFVAPWTLPNEAAWKADYLSILDTLNAQWPTAKIYLTKPWKTQDGGTDSMFDTMAGWVDDVIAARSAFTFAGDDERAWFKPNVATYSSDGIHFNAAGQIEAAAQRYAILFP